MATATTNTSASNQTSDFTQLGIDLEKLELEVRLSICCYTPSLVCMYWQKYFSPKLQGNLNYSLIYLIKFPPFTKCNFFPVVKVNVQTISDFQGLSYILCP